MVTMYDKNAIPQELLTGIEYISSSLEDFGLDDYQIDVAIGLFLMTNQITVLFYSDAELEDWVLKVLKLLTDQGKTIFFMYLESHGVNAEIFSDGLARVLKNGLKGVAFKESMGQKSPLN